MKAKTLICVLTLLIIAGTASAIEEPVLQVGMWVKAEPWHNWIGGAGRTSTVKLNVLDTANVIQRVDFYYSIDEGASWSLFGTDLNGQEPLFSTTDLVMTPVGLTTMDPALFEPGDGWSTVFPHLLVPQINMRVLFKSLAFTNTGDTLVAQTWRNYDPTPPDQAVVSYAWLNPETLLVSVSDPYMDIDSITIAANPEPEHFYKGIPGIDQHLGSDYHCLPTAAAACLKYFEGKGDPEITGGLTDSSLVDTLGKESGTNQGKDGTYIDDLVRALERWIASHGGNYTVRSSNSFDWNTASSELKRCQDVLAGIRWPNGKWHMMTFNSIDNVPNPDGTIRVDFMDPWTGEIAWGDYNPATGELSGFESSSGSGGQMINMVIICPNEKNPYISPGTDPIGGAPGPEPFPQPVPLSQMENNSLKVWIVDAQGNAFTSIQVVQALSTKPGPNQHGMVIPNFYLAQNSPNPFSDKTQLAFALPERAAFTLSIYNAAGQKVKVLLHETRPAGFYKLSWNAKDSKGRVVEPGAYFAKLETDSGFKQTVKMLIVR
ncbi:T9SS type A sorting domain-containing protein [bacterium]|nr:T9SS type A sorting domain-containing protein [bacterium]